jgi:hypothetical protein
MNITCKPNVHIWSIVTFVLQYGVFATLSSIIYSQKLVVYKNQSIGSPHSGQGRPGSQAPGICPQFVHIEVISSPNMNLRIREHI